MSGFFRWHIQVSGIMLNFAGMEKNATYQMLLKQVDSLLEGVNNPVGQLANAAALIHHTFHFWWTGFYRVVNGELLLGAFQGPVACYHIAKVVSACNLKGTAIILIQVNEVITLQETVTELLE